jgi:hypothetical protein
MGKAQSCTGGRSMSAIFMIIVFIVAIGLLNRLEFGRVD